MALRMEEVRELLAQKFALEKRRLKSFGTKSNSFDLANAVAPWVVALMADSRTRELRRLEKWLEKRHIKSLKVQKYLASRKRETKLQAQAINNLAKQKEEHRPWKGYSPR